MSVSYGKSEIIVLHKINYCCSFWILEKSEKILNILEYYSFNLLYNLFSDNFHNASQFYSWKYLKQLISVKSLKKLTTTSDHFEEHITTEKLGQNIIESKS